MKSLRIIVVVAIVAFVAVAILDIVMSPRAKIGGSSCYPNLEDIQRAKMLYAEDHNLTNITVFTKEQLLPYCSGHKWPQCPRGGEYSIGALHESPRCSYSAHANLEIPVN
jgi:hypothetical protein